jgi:hypothetical protein
MHQSTTLHACSIEAFLEGKPSEISLYFLSGAVLLICSFRGTSLGTDSDNPIDLIQARAAYALEHASYDQSL